MVYKGTGSGKCTVAPREGFLNVLERVLKAVDDRTYQIRIKTFLTDFIKYAPRVYKRFQKKQGGSREEDAGEDDGSPP